MYYLIRRKKKSDECFDERGDGYKGSGRWFLIYKVVSMTFCDLWGRTNYWGSTKKGQSSFKFAAARSWNLINFSDRNAGHLLCCVRRDREKAVNVSQVQFDKLKQPSGPFSNIYLRDFLFSMNYKVDFHSTGSTGKHDLYFRKVFLCKFGSRSGIIGILELAEW